MMSQRGRKRKLSASSDDDGASQQQQQQPASMAVRELVALATKDMRAKLEAQRSEMKRLRLEMVGLRYTIDALQNGLSPPACARTKHVDDLSDALLRRVLSELDPLFLADVAGFVCRRWRHLSRDASLWAGVSLAYGITRPRSFLRNARLFTRALAAAPVLHTLEVGLSLWDPQAVLRALETCRAGASHLCIDLDSPGGDAVLHLLENSRSTLQLFCLRERPCYHLHFFSAYQARRFWELIEAAPGLRGLVLFLNRRCRLAARQHLVPPTARSSLRLLHVEVADDEVDDGAVERPPPAGLAATLRGLILAHRSTLTRVELPTQVPVLQVLPALLRCPHLIALSAWAERGLGALAASCSLRELKLIVDPREPKTQVLCALEGLGQMQHLCELSLVQQRPRSPAEEAVAEVVAGSALALAIGLRGLRVLDMTGLPPASALQSLADDATAAPELAWLRLRTIGDDLASSSAVAALLPALRRLVRLRPRVHVALLAPLRYLEEHSVSLPLLYVGHDAAAACLSCREQTDGTWMFYGDEQHAAAVPRSTLEPHAGPEKGKSLAEADVGEVLVDQDSPRDAPPGYSPRPEAVIVVPGPGAAGLHVPDFAGEVSVCAEDASGWSCPAFPEPDERNMVQALVSDKVPARPEPASSDAVLQTADLVVVKSNGVGPAPLQGEAVALEPLKQADAELLAAFISAAPAADAVPSSQGAHSAAGPSAVSSPAFGSPPITVSIPLWRLVVSPDLASTQSTTTVVTTDSTTSAVEQLPAGITRIAEKRPTRTLSPRRNQGRACRPKPYAYADQDVPPSPFCEEDCSSGDEGPAHPKSRAKRSSIKLKARASRAVSRTSRPVVLTSSSAMAPPQPEGRRASGSPSSGPPLSSPDSTLTRPSSAPLALRSPSGVGRTTSSSSSGGGDDGCAGTAHPEYSEENCAEPATSVVVNGTIEVRHDAMEVDGGECSVGPLNESLHSAAAAAACGEASDEVDRMEVD